MKKSAFLQNLVLLLSFLFSVNLLAQNSSEITGKILDYETKEPLPGASVYVEVGANKKGASTEADGRFTIRPLTPGTYNVYISFIGYEDRIVKLVEVLPDQITYIGDIYMSEGGAVLPDVTVFAEPINRKNPTTVTIPAKKIEQLPTRNLLQIAVTFTPGVQVSDNGQQVIFRGSRPSSNNYYVDGMRVNDLNQSGVPSTSIGSMSVYTGGVPAKYGDFTGGVIVIETKTYFDLYNQWKANQL